MVKTRDLSRRSQIRAPSTRPISRVTPPPLDKDLSYYRDGLRWSFTGGKILLDGYDVNDLISETNTEIRSWLGIAGGLDEYRKRVVSSTLQRNQLTRFEAIIEALLGKVFGRLKKVYDQKMSGVAWSIENGQLILNGINIHSFLSLYRVKKTEKARKFLKGLKAKLGVLLENPQYEKIRPTVQRLYDEISEELSPKTPPGPVRTLPPRSDLDR